jgi:hypothetical protein
MASGRAYRSCRFLKGKVAKNRLHMDVRVSGEGTEDDRWRRVTALAEVLVEAGGVVLHPFPTHPVVMADPAGNEFCLGLSASTTPVDLSSKSRQEAGR